MIQFVSLVIGKAQHFNKHNKQSQQIWETLINTVTCSPKSCEEVESWLSKNDNTQIHQNTSILQDLIPHTNRPTSSCLAIFIYWAFKIPGSIFLGAWLVRTCENHWEWNRQVKWILLSLKT